MSQRSISVRNAAQRIVEELERRCLLSGGPGELDFGDVPDSYGTTLAANGARHLATPNLLLGHAVDTELDGQPSATADRDDFTGVPDDEDGIVFLDPIIPGGTVHVQVTNGTGQGRLNAWMDFNANGTFFDPPEQIFTNVFLPAASVTTLTFTVPATATLGQTYSRFRLNQNGGVGPIGFANDFGEVEDYGNRIQQPGEPMDFGDAPDTATGLFHYPTIFAGISGNPARHIIVTNGPRLGALEDPEPDGQPNLPATGDDLSILYGGVDDEDGVTVAGLAFETVSLTPGVTTTAQVKNGGATNGLLNAWFDWNEDGDWNDPGEQMATNVPIAAGATINLPIAVPATVQPNSQVYSRFRLSTIAGLTPAGLAQNGEVEDYRNRVAPLPPPDLDFGDAPDFAGTPFSYPIIFAGASGDPARHVITANGPKLGPTIDREPDGQPNLAATGDDLSILYGGVDDEDGITVGGLGLDSVSLVIGGTVTLNVNNSGAPGLLNAWFDWNNDGTWGAGEQVATNMAIPSGNTPLAVVVPASATGSFIYSRFRLSTAAGLTPKGLAPDGEVEDYRSRLAQQPPPSLDFGDAPDSPTGLVGYPTIFGGFSGDPARHIITANGPRLGPSVDPEPDGQPNTFATGDDLSIVYGGVDDENGVSVGGVAFELVPLQAGSVMSIQINNTGAPGLLNAWFDWNQNSIWEPSEQVAVNVPVPAGVFNLPVSVPGNLTANAQIYSRFRLSTAAGLLPTGLAPDGEVEDYRNRVIPDTTPPTATSGGLEFETRQAVRILFSEPMNPATFSAADLSALNLLDGTTPAANSVIMGPGNTSATWVFNTPGTFINDGGYSFTLAAGAVSDLAGNGLAGAFNLSGPTIFFFAGDADRNRTVNLLDFNIMAANFGTAGHTFSQGNFDYDAAGNVNLLDFNILAARFGTSVAPEPASQPDGPSPTGALPSLFGDVHIGDGSTTQDLLQQLLD